MLQYIKERRKQDQSRLEQCWLAEGTDLKRRNLITGYFKEKIRLFSPQILQIICKSFNSRRFKLITRICKKRGGKLGRSLEGRYCQRNKPCDCNETSYWNPPIVIRYFSSPGGEGIFLDEIDTLNVDDISRVQLWKFSTVNDNRLSMASCLHTDCTMSYHIFNSKVQVRRRLKFIY